MFRTVGIKEKKNIFFWFFQKIEIESSIEWVFFNSIITIQQKIFFYLRKLYQNKLGYNNVSHKKYF